MFKLNKNKYSLMKRVTGMTIISLLLMVNTAFAIGVTRPVPYDIELMRGEEARFTFQIQAVTSVEDQKCKYSMSNMGPLNVEFDLDEITVKAGSVKDIYGSISVPEDAPLDTYSGRLSVSCGAMQDQEVQGSVVYTTIGGSPFTAKVVELRTDNIKEITGENKEPIPYLIYVGIGIGIIILAGGIISLKRKSKKKK